MVYPFIVPFAKRFVGMWIKSVRGIENIPLDGAFVIVSNHCSYFDDITIPPIIMLRTNRKCHMYCNDRFYKNPILARFLEHVGCIPISIQTKNPDVNKKALTVALDYLSQGESVGVFPEGGRSLDGELQQAKTGAARLCLDANVPVLPIGIKGSFDVFPKGRVFPKLKRFEVRIGKPLDYSKYHGKLDKDTLTYVATDMMKTIGGLIDKEYPWHT